MANYSISYIYQIKDKMSGTIKKISSEVKKQTQEFKKQTTQVAKTIAAEEKFKKSLKRTRMEAKKLNDTLKFTADDVLNIGARLAALAFPVKKAMEFESKMAGVAKAAGLTKGTAEFDAMQDQILNMTKILPQSAGEIADIFQAGAKLGMGNEELEQFAKLAAKTGVAFDITADEAGTALASIKAKMGLNIDEVGNMMDAVNQLGNTTAANTSNMIEVLGRVSGTAKAVNLMPADAAGLAAFADQLAVSPQLAASGINQMIGKMQQIPAMNKALLEDPMKAIEDTLTSISKLDKEQQTVKITEIFGVEAGRFVQSAVNSMDLFKQTMGEVSEKTKFAGSMQKEFDTVMGTTSNQLDLATNAFMSVVIAIGLQLLPIVTLIIQGFTSFIQVIGAFIDMTGPLVPLLFGVTAAIFAMAAMQKIAIAVQGVFMLGINAMRTALIAARTAVLIFNAALMANPIGIAVAAVSALVAGLVVLYNKVEAVRTFFDDLMNTVAAFFGFAEETDGMDVTLNKNENISGELQAGDSATTATIDGTVQVGVTANNATVDSVQTTGANVSGRAVGYTSATSGM